MAQEICYTLADGRQMCIPLNVLIRRFPFSIPDSRRMELDRILVDTTRQDLVNLVKMQQTATNLSPKLQASMQTQLEQAVSQLDLPQGVTVNFGN